VVRCTSLRAHIPAPTMRVASSPVLFELIAPPCMRPPRSFPPLQVGELKRELATRDPAPVLEELEVCQARLRQSQATCGSKEAAVRELRQRLEQQTRYRHAGRRECCWAVQAHQQQGVRLYVPCCAGALYSAC
jgi:hypothetical protein